MEFHNKHPKIFLIAGKARHGKDTIGNYIKEYYSNQKCIFLSFAHYIKEYAMCISDWDGQDETKPRELLQKLGTELIREQIDEMLFIHRMIEDIRVYSYFFDIIIITDARLELEITTIRKTCSNVTVIHVERPSLVSELTQSQQQHRTETGLDHFHDYDYCIVNDGTLDALKQKVEKLLEEVE